MKRKQEGIGLVEVIFSLGIAVIIVTSLVSLAVFTLRTSVQNKLLIKGSSLATQEIELVRAYRDSAVSWDDFLDAIGDCEHNTCYIDDNLEPVVNDYDFVNQGTAEEVRTHFDVIEIGSDVVRIAVTARWRIGSEYKYAHNYTDLSDWRK